MVAVADRVKETTPTTGTGPVTLVGSSVGFRSFASAFGSGITVVYYTIAAGIEWEVGTGSVDGTAMTLARTSVLASSNGGALVNFSAGTKDVFCSYPAGRAVLFAPGVTQREITTPGANLIDDSSVAAQRATLGLQGILDDGFGNAYVGGGAGSGNTGTGNTFLGKSAGFAISSTGIQNVFVGFEAGVFSTGSENICIGMEAGNLLSGNNNVLIGSWAGVKVIDFSGCVVIGYNVAKTISPGASNVLWIHNADVSDPLIQGSFSGRTLQINGDLIIPTGRAVRMNSASGPLIKSGSGTPEGSITAPVGSMFMRTDGGAGTTLYIKESGTGNTGWVGK